ncbi:MAG: helix-turn-helix transcriptional regulator [Actinomycetota bacterium]
MLYAPAGDIEDLLQSQPVRVAAEALDVEVPTRPARDLITQAEIARIAGVSRQAVNNWTKTRRDFPRSAARGSGGRLWERQDVLRWLSEAKRVAGRPSRRESWPAAAAAGRSCPETLAGRASAGSRRGRLVARAAGSAARRVVGSHLTPMAL